MKNSWLNGFSDCHKEVFPKEAHNKVYMEGWFKCLGWYAGYKKQEPTCKEPSYLKGYEEGKNERTQQESNKNKESNKDAPKEPPWF